MAMNEEFLIYLWKYGLFDRTSLISDTGEKIEVIKLGERNLNSGPDFINAKIRIGNTLWAGNVELHLNASDWKRHRHQADKAYDNVILHVVMNTDHDTKRTNGTTIPTVELRFEPQLYSNYMGLIGNQNRISCHDRIARIDPLLLHSWLSSVMVERLEIRVRTMDGLLEQYLGSWDEVFYIQLARSFGFHLNALPFEQVARSLPLTILARHDNNLFQLEALLFGQAGFLSGEGEDDYALRLKEEYNHLRNKYGLKPLDQHLWKFMRLRPINFPTLRLAQFAALIHNLPGLFRNILETGNLSSLVKVFTVQPSRYWETHYKFGTVSAARKKTLGEESSRTLLINTIIPIIFLYGHKKDDDKLKARAIEFLSHLPPEKNAVITRWEKAGVHAGSALDTQALLQVWSDYCQRKQCLRCMVGSKIIVSGGNL
jgi:Protein of unknown function (DUF2851)